MIYTLNTDRDTTDTLVKIKELIDAELSKREIQKKIEKSDKEIIELKTMISNISQWASEAMKLNEKMIEFLEFRISIKKPIKPASQSAFIRRLETMSWKDPAVAVEILETSIANGWQGIFPLKNSTSSQSKVWVAQA